MAEKLTEEEMKKFYPTWVSDIPPRVGRVEGGPPWWPNFDPPSFSEEELWEIERYCQKIIENVKEEGGMTPKERWKTTLEWGLPDRPFVLNLALNMSTLRALDNWTEALKPGIDAFWYPKLILKAHFLWGVRFKTDHISPYVLTYGENEASPKSVTRMLPKAPPAMWVKPGIDTFEELDTIVHEMDPYRDGFWPPYMWVVRKTKQFMKKHGVSDYLPLIAYFCPEPTGHLVALIGMKKGWPAYKRQPEVVIKAAELDKRFRIKFAKALREEGADDLMMCSMTPGWIGLEAWKPYNHIWVEIEEALKPYGGFTHLLSCDCSQALEYMIETGAIRRSFNSDHATPWDVAAKIGKKYKKAYSPYFDAVMLSTGPAERIVNTVKTIVKNYAGPGFWCTNPTSEYYAKPEYIELAEKTYKEYGKEIFQSLRK
jgi:hypothetical protein